MKILERVARRGGEMLARAVPWVLAVLAVGCYSGEVTWMDYPTATDSGGGDAVAPADAPVGEGVDAGPTLAPSGAACQADGDCFTGSCFTSEFLAGLGLNYDVPNGMCSKLGCQEDAECGEGGICFDSSPFSGMPINLCLAVCESTFDCRYAGGYSCFFSDATGDLKACLPTGIVLAIRCGMSPCKCGDGACDDEEAAAGSCPEDCP